MQQKSSFKFDSFKNVLQVQHVHATKLAKVRKLFSERIRVVRFARLNNGVGHPTIYCKQQVQNTIVPL